MNCESYSKLLVDNFPDFVKKLLKDLKGVDEVFKNPENRAFFLNILINNKDKREVLEKIIKDFSKESKNLLLFLSERKRYDIIVDLYDFLNKEWLKKSGKIKGLMIFPYKPNKKVLNSSLKLLNSITNKEVEYEVDIDKNIIGGFVFKSDKFIVDVSVKYQLKKLQQSILR